MPGADKRKNEEDIVMDAFFIMFLNLFPLLFVCMILSPFCKIVMIVASLVPNGICLHFFW